VASYAYLLDFIVQKIRGLAISRTGGIYLPPFQLQTFRMDFLLPKIDRFFREDLPNILTKKTVPWHYNSRCRTCEFVNVCRKDAEGSIAMIPYLSLEKAVDLKTFIRDWKSGEDNVDIEDLSNYFDELNIEDENAKSSDQAVNKRIKHIVKYDKKLKSSPYLKAIETKQAQVKMIVYNFQIIFFTKKSLFV
jgi:hypothetical protein